jgi:hypothetical protein
VPSLCRFIRQFVARLISSLKVTDNSAQLLFQPIGRFLGQTIRDANCRIPPLEFLKQKRQGAKWELVNKAEIRVDASIGKLGFRFANMHGAQLFPDGSCLIEMLCYDPKHFFSVEAMTMHSLFNTDGVHQWAKDMQDTDESGLPKTMVKPHWDRRIFEAKAGNDADGTEFLRICVTVYAFDPATGAWSHLRASVDYQYTRDLDARPIYDM